jgi:protein involved in polysaccharide export with SLBB domain
MAGSANGALCLPAYPFTFSERAPAKARIPPESLGCRPNPSLKAGRDSLNLFIAALAVAGLMAPRAAAAQGASSVVSVVSAVALQPDSTALRPGDAIRLRIWLEPDLSGEFPVDQRGMTTLPMIGDFPVTAMPADSIRPQLISAYARYLRNPTIEVTFLRRITITGAVAKPGVYPVEPTMTVTDALALAGGPAPDGKRDRVELRRNKHRLKANLSEDARVGDIALRSGDELYVPQKGWLSRNQWIATSLIGAAVTITTIMVTR